MPFLPEHLRGQPVLKASHIKAQLYVNFCRVNRISFPSLKKGYWQSGGSTLWREPTSNHDHWTQHGRSYRCSYCCCQSHTIFTGPLRH